MVHNHDNTLNIMVIGLGPHGRSVYLPVLKSLQPECNISVAGVVDYATEREAVLKSIHQFGFENSCTFVEAPPRKKGECYCLTSELRRSLEQLLEKEHVRAAIISTEPISHMAYTEWALENGLHVLVDKPLTARPFASVEIQQAYGIEEDYVKLVELVKSRKYARTGEKLVFRCMLQRRFQSGYLDMREMIKRVFSVTNCPPTSITIVHNDGQWRFPKELYSESYHGFDEGIGELTHTGYHYLDMIPWFLKVARPHDYPIDNVVIYASFTRPNDIVSLLPSENIERLFGTRHKDSEGPILLTLREDMKTFGEVDAHLAVRFCHLDSVICNVNLTLLHSGLSYRHWADTQSDPYINKGRMKQETVLVYQGPFLAAQSHKYRATKDNSLHRDQFGGEDHNEINYLINDKVLKMGLGPLVRKSFRERTDELGIKSYKIRCIQDFVAAVVGKTIYDDNFSIEEHLPGVKLLSGAYVAGARGFLGEAAVHSFPFEV